MNRKQEKLYNFFAEKYSKKRKGIDGIIQNMIGNVESLDDELSHAKRDKFYEEDIEGINELLDSYLSLMSKLAKRDYRLTRGEYELLDEKFSVIESYEGSLAWISRILNLIDIID